MKVAKKIANEMLKAHGKDIMSLPRDDLRQKIELHIEKEWASPDPEELASKVMSVMNDHNNGVVTPLTGPSLPSVIQKDVRWVNTKYEPLTEDEREILEKRALNLVNSYLEKNKFASRPFQFSFNWNAPNLGNFKTDKFGCGA